MTRAILASLLIGTSSAFAQTPAPKPPATSTQATPAPRPATPTPAPARGRAAAPARGGIAITATDPRGLTLPGITVELLGGSDRSAETNASGQVNFPGLQAGTYRLRFSGDRIINFEREVTIRANQVADVDVTLNAAPPPPEPPPTPPPAPEPQPVVAAVGPAGTPQTLSIIDLVEREVIQSNQPRRETLVSCSGNTRTTLVQLNQDQPERLYDTAEVNYYVVAGEGALRIGGRDTAISAGSYLSIPRNTGHTLVRRGRRPLILLSTLSGAPCEQPR